MLIALPRPVAVAPRLARIFLEQFHKLLRLCHRQRPQHDGVHQAEDRRVGAETERERRNHDYRDYWTAPHTANRIADVLRDLLKEPPSPHIARGLPHEGPIAEFASRGELGLP